MSKKFDVMENLEKILELNRAIYTGQSRLCHVAQRDTR